MEAIKHALGYDTASTTTTDNNNNIGGGEAPQNTSSFSNTQSGVEPASGRLGTGSAGQPYDAGNENLSTRASDYGGADPYTLGARGDQQAGSGYGNLESQRGTGAGYGSSSGQTGYGQTGTNSGSTMGKIGSAMGMTGTTSGTDREHSSGTGQTGYGQSGYGQTGYDQTGTNSGSTMGKIGSAMGMTGTTSGTDREYSSGTGQTGYGQSGYGQTGYDQTGTNSGSTIGKIGSALGMTGATSGNDREYASGNSRSGLSGGHSGLSDGQTSSTGGFSSGLSGSNNNSTQSEGLGDLTGDSRTTQAHGHALKGSDLGVGSNDRYLYNARTAPGYGGRSHDDDFSHANVHNIGSGKDLFSDLGSTVAAGHSDGSTSGTGSGSTSEVQSRPARQGLRRTGTGMGGGESGLESGRSANNRNYDNNNTSSSSGYGSGAAAGITSGLAAIGLSNRSNQSGTEPISGRQGSGVAGEAYDAGNTGRTSGLEAQRGDNVRSYEGQQGASQGYTGGVQDNSYSNKPYSQGTDFVGGDNSRGSQVGTTGQGVGGYGSRGISDDRSEVPPGGPIAGYTQSGHGPSGHSHNVGGITGSNTQGSRSLGHADEIDHGCAASSHGYQPHGGHPIGEAAHQTDEGKATWLNYHDDPKVVLGEKFQDAV